MKPSRIPKLKKLGLNLDAKSTRETQRSRNNKRARKMIGKKNLKKSPLFSKNHNPKSTTPSHLLTIPPRIPGKTSKDQIPDKIEKEEKK